MHKRDRVRVEGKEFSSLAKAFAALDLPMAKHQKFRQLLKQQRRASFEGYEFEIIE